MSLRSAKLLLRRNCRLARAGMSPWWSENVSLVHAVCVCALSHSPNNVHRWDTWVDDVQSAGFLFNLMRNFVWLAVPLFSRRFCPFFQRPCSNLSAVHHAVHVVCHFLPLKRLRHTSRERIFGYSVSGELGSHSDDTFARQSLGY